MVLKMMFLRTIKRNILFHRCPVCTQILSVRNYKKLKEGNICLSDCCNSDISPEDVYDL